jgi:CIC family chloride channel protein
LIIVAMGVGVLGGIGAVVFREMIALSNYAFFDILLPFISLKNSTYDYAVILLPTLGAIIVGIIIARYAIEVKGHGIPQVIESMAFRSGRIKYHVAAAKIIASSITIGSGGSAGREGPIAQIGAAFGSMTGQIMKLSDRDVELLVVCGLASAIAATFNAPLGGAVFGLEILFRKFDVMEAMPVLLSCVLGTLVARLFLGDFLTFPTLPNVILQPHELLIYAAFGIMFGILSAAWVKLYYLIEGGFESANRVPFVLKVAIGGAVTGLVGLPFYTLSLGELGDKSGFGVYGIGYEGMNSLFLGLLPITLILALGLVKMLCTSFTLGSGASGGLLLPTFYIGTMLGGAFGLAMYSMSPLLISQPYALALVGAATLFAGAYGTPIASIIFIPEMSMNYYLLLPLMLSCSLSHLTARRLLRGSTINTLSLERKGILLSQLTDQMRTDLLSRVKVGDVATKKFVAVDPKTTVWEIYHLMSSKDLGAVLVMKNNVLIGLVNYTDFMRVPSDEFRSTQAKDVVSRAELIGPEMTLAEALSRMNDRNVPRLVVVDPVSKKPAGLLTQDDIVKGYEAARHGHPIFEADPLKRIKARDIMIRNPVIVRPDQKLETIIDILKRRTLPAYPVVERGALVGIVTAQGLSRKGIGATSEMTVRSIMEKDVPTAFPDETLSIIVERMHRFKTDAILVVAKGKEREVIGIISGTEIIKGYEAEK